MVHVTPITVRKKYRIDITPLRHLEIAALDAHLAIGAKGVASRFMVRQQDRDQAGCAVMISTASKHTDIHPVRANIRMPWYRSRQLPVHGDPSAQAATVQ